MAEVDPFAARLEELKAEQPAGDDPFAARLSELKAGAPQTGLPGYKGRISEPGNIDLGNRPRHVNPDGSTSTVRSASFNIDGKEVLLPTIADDGRPLTDDEAVAQYQKTGRHLGKFDTPEDATAYAQALHEQQAATLPPQPGFFRRGLDSIEHGAGTVKHVLGTLTHQAGQRFIGMFGAQHEAPPTPEQGAAQVRELTRGVDDILTLGKGQKLAARIGNALGDTPQNSLDETRHFAGPLTGDVGGPSQRQARDAELAPEFRDAGQTMSIALPSPVGEAVGGVGGALLRRVLPVGVKAAASRVPSVIAGPAQALGNYAAVAPVQAALAAEPGHRAEAAKAAVMDPGALMIAAALGGVGVPIRKALLGSEGAQLRNYIEQHGEGAKVGPFTAGKGGVYQNQLAGLPENDAGVGEASLRGSRAIVGDIEQRHEAQHGYPYRGGQEMVGDAEAAARDANQRAQLDVTLAKEQRRAQVKAAKNEALTETAARANKVVGDLEAEKRQNVSEPYRVVKQQIDNSDAARQTRDITPIVATMQEAVHDLGTSDFARAKLETQLKLLERRRDPTSGAVVLNERELNELRGNLMRTAKVGQSDVRGKAEAPLRAAAFSAKELVDQGPYADINRLFAEGSGEIEGKRQGVGLKKKPGKDRVAETENLAKRFRKGLNDPTQVPNPSVAPEADLTPLRQKIAEAEQSAQPAIEEARQSTAAARAVVKGAKAKKAAGDEAAIPDRKMLGLNTKIGSPETDINQVSLRLRRENANSETAGASQADLEAYAKAHPDQATNTRLADLMRNRLDLKYTLGAPAHGGLLGGRASPMGLYRMLKANTKPLAARVAYGPAKKIDPIRLARALGATRGSTLGEKIKAALEADKEQRQ